MPDEPSEAPPRRPSIIGDPLRTTLVLLIIIGVLAGARALLSDDPPDPAPPVDYTAAVDAAREAAPYDLLAPDDLPDGWRATNVVYESGTGVWRMAVNTDARLFIGLEQSPEELDVVLDEVAPDAEPAGEVEINGRTWQQLDDGRDGLYVTEDGGGATVVRGDAAAEDLRAFVESLTSTGTVA